MRTLARRGLLESAALVLPLVACGSLGPVLGPVVSLVTDPAVAALSAKVKTLVDGLGLLPSSVTGAIDAVTLTKVQGWVTDLGSLATAISGTTSLATAKPLVTQLGVIFDDVVGALPAGTLSTQASSLLAAGTTYLPLIEDLVGLVGQRHPGAARFFGGMSPGDAERVLIAAAATAAVHR